MTSAKTMIDITHIATRLPRTACRVPSSSLLGPSKKSNQFVFITASYAHEKHRSSTCANISVIIEMKHIARLQDLSGMYP